MKAVKRHQLSYESNGLRKLSTRIYPYNYARRLVARLRARGNDAYIAGALRISVPGMKYYIDLPDGTRVHDGRGNDWACDTRGQAARIGKRLGLKDFTVTPSSDKAWAQRYINGRPMEMQEI